MRSGFLAAAVALLSIAVPAAAAPATEDRPAGRDWPMGGADLANTRSNPAERRLGPQTVDRLGVRWTLTTTGDVSATPAVVDGALYFPDWGGTLWKVDARTGRPIWSHPVGDYVGVPGTVSRSSPAVVGNTVYLGTLQGAWLLAVDARTGTLRWKSRLDTHPQAVLTQSPVVHDGLVLQSVSSEEEGAAVDPTYPCCTFRGSLVAVAASTGRTVWRADAIPDQGPSTDIFSGAAIWGGTPAVDPATGTVYVATGNNYTVPAATEQCQAAGGTPAQCLPSWNHINTVLAYDVRTGRLKWATGQDRFDSWNVACLPGAPPNNCPSLAGPDWDFGDGVHLFTLPGGRRAVGLGQKSGEFWMLDAASGSVVWSSAVGPGGEHGGIQWGTATDGNRIYFTETDSERLPYRLPDGRTIDYSSFGALDAATGRILWQIPEPYGDQAMAAVTTANGVVYAAAMSGRMYALDAATGRVLWQFQAAGSANAGAAVAGGTVYWGDGYSRWGQGTPSTTFYAFALP